MKTDFLVIGTGIAGLSYALNVSKARPDLKVVVLCKSKNLVTNTRLAQGGIAVVVDKIHDSFEKHYQDTLIAGDGLCKKNVVKFVVKEGPDRLKELINYGAKFDKNASNNFQLAREGGHSLNRVVHAGDYSGLEVQNTLLNQIKKQSNIKLLTQMIAVELITHVIKNGNRIAKQTNSCHGAIVLDARKRKLISIHSRITILATGGVGQLFANTTNSEFATGDGIAMAYRAGAKIKNMAFIQFHPTALAKKNGHTQFLISEAVRGQGAVLKDKNHQEFMSQFDSRRDLATRDIVSRAIATHLNDTGTKNVYLDCTSIAKNEFIKHFPTIYKKCRDHQLNPSLHCLPVIPSAHYCCGGISSDINGETNIRHLYVCGESANTGLHGANRLASNSLLEALVFAHRSALKSLRKIDTIQVLKNEKKHPSILFNTTNLPEIKSTIHFLKKTLTASFGIITNFKHLEKGIAVFEKYKKSERQKYSHKLCELSLQLLNMIDTSLLILYDAKKRKINRGVYFNTDLEKKSRKISITKKNKI